ncbi:uncharacterized protein EI90DRAFT_2988693 [Cantharellus anzutake]|uniref:uncharacterized protein n=1 Tax=Cantharellus anzutake TaxID=1750568 RepID=UPI0019060CF6|nr:uncharacterized protein EI90DRAFT_2988693 [Cantharellus anzutake]KAF8342194.1 hypothetical protein EI90DRAFT_2988693 [Cantharellus anzutake]
MSNPSHVLIARSSRSSQPVRHATLSSPLETHAAASGVFPRNSTSPPVVSYYASDDDSEDEGSTTDYREHDEPIEVDATFREDARFPGTVKITVGATTFWTHKEVLFFASPFFEAALSGGWRETGRRASVASSIITISQPPQIPKSANSSKAGTDRRTTLVTEDHEVFQMSADENTPKDDSARDAERDASLKKLESAGNGTLDASGSAPRTHHPIAIAYIVLQEEKGSQRCQCLCPLVTCPNEQASTFHDFLKFVYPHLECVITWNNVEGLMNISHKLVVPALQKECMTFLLTHAAGKPIKALRIAELFEEEELYRESSRFVLDNPGVPEAEMQTLSQETLLKLERRRSWFLERVLKLGLVPIAKEYQCCLTCPDSANCARSLEEKWKQGYQALFRFGPAQPSMVFRYLRQLEGVSPPLSLTHHSCQLTAKAWVSTLFDRMFSLGMRNGPDVVPQDPRIPSSSSGPRRHFLFCPLREDKKPTRKTRVVT